jgi:hypothetical protein
MIQIPEDTQSAASQRMITLTIFSRDTALGTRPREHSSKIALCKFENVNT